MDGVGWKRQEGGLKLVCMLSVGFMLVLRSKSVEESPSFPKGTRTYALKSEALTAQYLNVRQRKLGTIIIQTVHILQHDSAVTG
jgi:hypothetical protein